MKRKIAKPNTLALQLKTEIVQGFCGWTRLLGASITQLVAVNIACLGAAMRWVGRTFMLISSQLFRKGKHMKTKINLEWEDGIIYGAEQL